MTNLQSLNAINLLNLISMFWQMNSDNVAFDSSQTQNEWSDILQEIQNFLSEIQQLN